MWIGAHGRELDTPYVETWVACLAVHSSGTLARLPIGTWQDGVRLNDSE